MDHDATREQLELAALEPGGLDRLMAGDTATSQAVAAHLAGCPSCIDELARLERATRRIRETVREMPPPDLRARTMAAIRAEGVPRGAHAAPATQSVAATSGRAGPLRPAPFPGAGPVADEAGVASRRGFAISWVAAVAAAVVLSVVATSFVVGHRVDEALATQARTIGALEEVTIASLELAAQADAEYVELIGRTDGSIEGSLVFSPATADLVVVATGLAAPPAGKEYRCWVAAGGARQRVGKMYFSGKLAYWVGPAPAVAGLAPGATFGVSLVDLAGPSVDTDPVLLGEL